MTLIKRHMGKAKRVETMEFLSLLHSKKRLMALVLMVTTLGIGCSTDIDLELGANEIDGQSDSGNRGQDSNTSSSVLDFDDDSADDGVTNSNSPSEMSNPQPAFDLGNCDYPAWDTSLAIGNVVPPFAFATALNPDGSQTSFSFADFYCNPAFDDYNSMLVGIVAQNCLGCDGLIAAFERDQSALDLFGTYTLYLTAMDINTGYAQTSQASHDYVEGYANKDFGLRVGSLDQSESAADLISWLPSAFPDAAFIDRDTMEIVARELPSYALMSEELASVSGNNDASGCLEENPDVSSSRGQATLIGGSYIETYLGGICSTDDVDVYKYAAEGSWTVNFTLESDSPNVGFRVIQSAAFSTDGPVVYDNPSINGEDTFSAQANYYYVEVYSSGGTGLYTLTRTTQD